MAFLGCGAVGCGASVKEIKPSNKPTPKIDDEKMKKIIEEQTSKGGLTKPPSSGPPQGQ